MSLKKSKDSNFYLYEVNGFSQIWKKTLQMDFVLLFFSQMNFLYFSSFILFIYLIKKKMESVEDTQFITEEKME